MHMTARECYHVLSLIIFFVLPLINFFLQTEPIQKQLIAFVFVFYYFIYFIVDTLHLFVNKAIVYKQMGHITRIHTHSVFVYKQHC